MKIYFHRPFKKRCCKSNLFFNTAQGGANLNFYDRTRKENYRARNRAYRERDACAASKYMSEAVPSIVGSLVL